LDDYIPNGLWHREKYNQYHDQFKVAIFVEFNQEGTTQILGNFSENDFTGRIDKGILHPNQVIRGMLHGGSG